MGNLANTCSAALRLAAVGIGLTVASMSYTGNVFAQTVEKVAIASLPADLGGVPLIALAQDKEVQAKHGIEVSLTLYPTIPAIWTAFTAGEFDILPGGPGGFAAFAAKGGPVRVISTYATSNANLVGKMDKIETADGLRGKRVTAPVGGLWKLTAAQIEAKFGLEVGDYELIPVPTMLSGITQVLAGTADLAMGWEPDTTRVLLTYPDLKIALQSADLRPADEVTHIQVLVAYDHVTDTAAEKFTAALSDVMEKVRADPKAAEEIFWDFTGGDRGSQPDVFATAVSAGRYNLDAHALTPSDKAAIEADIKAVVPEGVPANFLGN